MSWVHILKMITGVLEKKLRSLHGLNYLAKQTNKQKKKNTKDPQTLLQRSGSSCLVYDF